MAGMDALGKDLYVKKKHDSCVVSFHTNVSGSTMLSDAVQASCERFKQDRIACVYILMFTPFAIPDIFHRLHQSFLCL